MPYIKDTSAWEKLKKNLLSLNNKDIKVGWFENQRYGEDNGNIQMAEVAYLNEEGHINGPDAAFPGTVTPPRPFMQVGLKDLLKSGKADHNFFAVIALVISGQSPLRALNQAGPYMVKHLQNTMDAWDSPPNSRATQNLKGFNDPLNKTHALIDKVSFEVGKTEKD